MRIAGCGGLLGGFWGLLGVFCCELIIGSRELNKRFFELIADSCEL